jgi:chromosome segregation ATPase
MSILSWVKDNWITVTTTVVATVATGGANLVATAIAFGAGYLLDADRKQREQEDKKLNLAGKAGESIRKEVNGLQNQRTQLTNETEELVQQLNKHKSKLNDPNATEEEKNLAKRMIPIIQSNLDDKEGKINDLNKKIDDLLKTTPGVENQTQAIDFNKLLLIGGGALVIYFLLLKDKDK